MIGTTRCLLWFTCGLLLSACSQTQEPAAPAPSTAASPAQPDTAPASGQIETAVVSYKPVQPELVLVGKIAYGEDRYSKISSPLQGRVVEVRAKLGDRVQAGATLLVIDSPDITAAYSEFVKEASELEYSTRAQELAKELYATKALALKDLKQAENDLIKARAEFRRAKERLLSLRIPAAELEKPLAQQRITSRFEMKSPLTGTVVERMVTPGQSVGSDASQVLFTVADLDRLQVVADVYERDLALVKVSQVGRINVEAYPGTDFASVVASIGDVVDPNTRTIKVRAWVDNQDQRLKPEMFARLRLDIGDATPFLTIPKEAVVEIDGKHFVYVVEAPDRYAKREVMVSNVSSDQVRILEGLTSGQRIVIKGAVLVKGQEVKG
ncbi:efflux RND transporter periplasmic adaptor subunit [Nitrospirales bacterium NOB]|nr:MAG: putative acriflavine resistance protein A [Nitrospira sp. OLB3]MCE7965806.1 efflux RND transporter periplasmic adaptor subunit [Nitrospira sp. NTP2]MCK6494206.1 efflux RND transporter periplasmic adaptor subunit [Nitrospira sp.]MDL1890513.1 efflux RND transporter periplasmic adaptor subunit [Nitrospirales bacterium NOB]